MDSDQLVARGARAFEILIGSVAGVAGCALLVLAAFVAVKVKREVSVPVLVFELLSLVLGLVLCVAGLRLVTARRRADGGLLSPWILRLGGVIFLFGPVAAVLNRSWFALLEAGVSLSAAVACFALANRRSETAADQGPSNNRWSGP